MIPSAARSRIRLGPLMLVIGFAMALLTGASAWLAWRAASCTDFSKICGAGPTDADNLHNRLLARVLASQAEGRDEAARGIIALGIHLDPRAESFRRAALLQSVQDGDTPSLVHAMTALYRLEPSARRELTALLIGLFNDDTPRPDLIAALAASGATTQDLRRAIARDGALLPENFALQGEDLEALSLLAQRLADAQRWQEALLWQLRLTPGAREQGLRWPVNGQLARPDRPTLPYDWKTSERFSQWARDGGIYLTALPERPGVLMQQTMLVQPGSYVLRLSARVDQREEGAGFDVAMQCLNDSSTRILLHRLAPTGDEIVGIPLRLEIPRECPVQQLSVQGTRGLIAFRGQMFLQAISLEQAS